MNRLTKQAGEARFQVLLDEHRGIVFKVAHVYCHRADDRDDLVQEICLQLWRSFPSYDPERRFSTWMYRVALNTAISFARSRQGHTQDVSLSEYDEAGQFPAPEPGGSRSGLLQRLLHRLPKLDRALVVLYLEGRSYAEIAEVIGISESNVGTKLNRLKQRMRSELAASEE